MPQTEGHTITGDGRILFIGYGSGVLAPDAGGGFLIMPPDPNLIGARAVATYDADVVFVAANAGQLLADIDGTGAITIISSNVADNNGVQWIVVKLA